jgi:hypothetical protein
MVLSKLDEMGKVAWVAVVFAAFWAAWPLGLAVLAYLVGSGRLRAWRTEAAPGAWFNLSGKARAGFKAAAARPTPSGNAAFDAYREDTLRRLEDEQREFQNYLERLRQARDKAEFDQFMAERRPRPVAPAPVETADAA